MKPKMKEIPIDLLNLDSENPRLNERALSTNEALTQLIMKLGDKLIVLAKDISEYGLDPSQALIVVKNADDRNYKVLEGNRRLAAIWMLLDPSVANGLVNVSDFQDLIQAGQRYLGKGIIDKVKCIEFDNVEEANHWIELRHTGENEGAGLIRWGAQEIRRHNERLGKRHDPLMALLDYLEENGFISTIQRKQVPITTLERLIKTLQIKKALGLKIKKDAIELQDGIEDNSVKILVRMIDDLVRGVKKVSDLYTAEQRSAYLKEIIKDNSGTSSLGGKDSSSSDKSNESNTEEEKESENEDNKSGKEKKTRQVPHTFSRPHLIPETFRLRITNQRITNVYHELRTLEIDSYPNAVSVLFRLFLEFSANEYLINKGINNFEQIRSFKLSEKIKRIATYLESNGWSSDQTLPFIKEVNQPNSIYSISNFHSYVHNHLFNPNPMVLKTVWDNFEPLIFEIWKDAKN